MNLFEKGEDDVILAKPEAILEVQVESREMKSPCEKEQYHKLGEFHKVQRTHE